MPLPETGSVSVQGGGTESKPAFLLKVPEHLWRELETSATSGSRVKVSLDGGLSLILPSGDAVSLQAHTTGAPTEIHLLNSSNDALVPIALASARLSAPISTTTSGRVGDKAKPTNGILGKVGKPNGLPQKPVAVGVAALAGAGAGTTMSRTQSSPAGSTTSSATAPHTPVVPLKTRVVQLLALGPCEESEMMRKVGGVEGDVMRVVNVVGRKTSTSPPTYELQPSQYSKIKIGGWKYSTSEKRIVIERARKAFDELKLPPDADERIEMDKKEAEALSSSSTSSSSNSVSSEHPSQASTSSNTHSHSHSHSQVPRPSSAAPQKHALPMKPTTIVRAGGSSSADSDSKSGKNGANNKKSAIGRQLDKFRAERRTASLPNGKREDGVASPRMGNAATLASTKAEDLSAKPKSAATTKPKTKSTQKAEKPNKEVTARRRSRDYTSSESSDDEDALPTPKKARTSPRPPISKSKPKRQTDGSSHRAEITDDDSERGRPSKRPSPIPVPARRKSPPAQLQLQPNGHTHTHAPMAPPAKSPEDMRERYEELYPAYQQLAQKLTVVYQNAEDAKVHGVLSVSREEVEKMVARWQKWHAELEGIRACFGEEGA